MRGVSWLLWNAVRRQVIVFDFIFLAFLRFPSRHSTLRAECGWSSGTPVHTYVRFEGLISIWGDAGLTPNWLVRLIEVFGIWAGTGIRQDLPRLAWLFYETQAD